MGAILKSTSAMHTFPLLFVIFISFMFNKIQGSPNPKPENDVHFHVNIRSKIQNNNLPTQNLTNLDSGSDYSEDDWNIKICSAHSACHTGPYGNELCAIEAGENSGKCTTNYKVDCKTEADC